MLAADMNVSIRPGIGTGRSPTGTPYRIAVVLRMDYSLHGRREHIHACPNDEDVVCVAGGCDATTADADAVTATASEDAKEHVASSSGGSVGRGKREVHVKTPRYFRRLSPNRIQAELSYYLFSGGYWSERVVLELYYYGASYGSDDAVVEDYEMDPLALAVKLKMEGEWGLIDARNWNENWPFDEPRNVRNLVAVNCRNEAYRQAVGDRWHTDVMDDPKLLFVMEREKGQSQGYNSLSRTLQQARDGESTTVMAVHKERPFGFKIETVLSFDDDSFVRVAVPSAWYNTSICCLEIDLSRANEFCVAVYPVWISTRPITVGSPTRRTMGLRSICEAAVGNKIPTGGADKTGARKSIFFLRFSISSAK
eukprot:scaffold275050_cov53-Attheya_sp.AAC.1